MRQIVITISDIYLDQLGTLVQSLREDGVIVTHFYEFGVIIAIADETVLSRIRNRKEIIALNEEQEATIPPPEADIQIFPDE